MRLVLSRKGFDSKAGGGPSPILPDGRFLSLPIPEPRRNNCPRLGYEELRWHGTKSYRDVIQELGLPMPDASAGAHLDPDLAAHPLPRLPGWRPAFGQTDSAQTHLAKQGVGVGDIFLFFGLFRRTRERDGALRWDHRSSRVHALFGYLEVGEVVPIASAEDAARLVDKCPWIAQHPHVRGWHRRNNTLYISAERCSLAPERSGAGLLRWGPRVCLSGGARGPSIWRLPPCFAPSVARPLSYHRKLSRWTAEPDGTVTLRTVGRGQEFVIEADGEISSWAGTLIHSASLSESLICS